LRELSQFGNAEREEETKMNTATLYKIPTCDMCNLKPAKYDAPTVFGPWAYQCELCYLEQGSPKLGSILKAVI
jgi:hypothetical protein